jgi:hypothetical protein
MDVNGLFVRLAARDADRKTAADGMRAIIDESSCAVMAETRTKKFGMGVVLVAIVAAIGAGLTDTIKEGVKSLASRSCGLPFEMGGSFRGVTPRGCRGVTAKT